MYAKRCVAIVSMEQSRCVKLDLPRPEHNDHTFSMKVNRFCSFSGWIVLIHASQMAVVKAFNPGRWVRPTSYGGEEARAKRKSSAGSSRLHLPTLYLTADIGHHTSASLD